MVKHIKTYEFDRGHGAEYFKLVLDSSFQKYVLLYYHRRKNKSYYWILRTNWHSVKIFENCFHLEDTLWTKIFAELWHSDAINENYFEEGTSWDDLDATPTEYMGDRFKC